MAAQVASSRRNDAAKRQQQARRSAPEPKILRIGIIHNGRIVEERLIPGAQVVTVGESPTSTIVVAGAELPSKRFELFGHRGGTYQLNFTKTMHGKVSVDDKVVTLASLASSGQAKRKGTWASLELTDRNRGKVYVGDHTILFQFVTPPPQPARQSSADFRAFRWEEVDWIFLAILLLSALLHTAVVVWMESLPPPKKMRLEDFPDRFVKVMLPEDPPPPTEEPEVTDENADGPETDAAADAAEEAPPEEAAPAEDAGGGSDEPVESAEDRRDRLEEEVSSKGLLALIGTAGESSAGSAVADLLSDASALSDDVGKALANSSGVVVGRRDSDRAGLRGGGGGDGAAGIGEIGSGPGGGQGGAVAQKKVEIKGSVKTDKADIASSPEDVSSVKKTMRRYTGRIKACYERQLKSNPDLKGKVTVSFDISTAGSVSGVGIEENTTGNAELATCIKREVGRIKFNPPPSDDVEVAGYPFILSPG